MRLCRKSSVVGLGVVAAMSMSAVPPAAAGDEAPVVTRPPAAEMGKESEVPGHYIVVMKSGTGGAQRSVAARQVLSTGGRVSVEFHTALNGFAAKLSAQAVEALRRNPHVQYVEPDTEVRTTDTQTSAPWGLDRVDQRSLPLNKRYEYDSTGAGVTAYIIDSGIRKTHSQFGGRVAGGFTAIGDGRGTNDCNGHGTHVAGTVGSSRYGVAKQVTLRPVRVLNCKGTGRTSGVIAGVDWVTAHHTAGNPAVANISIGGPASRALDAAVRRSILDGVTYAVAAGNESQDACSSSPASVGSALTVGATTKSDSRPAFSNTGPCVDLFAPGAAILSTWHKSNTATQTLSGTSMAAPHVAGAAALLLQKRPSASPDQVVQAILDSATTGVVANRGTGSPNRLLHSQGTIPPPPTSNNVFVNGGFEQGTNGWTASTKVITDDAWAPAHQGSWKAWLNGYGEANTNTLKQTVTLPAAGAPHLDFFLMIGTDDGTGNVYDTLKVAVVSGGVSVPLATYSNMDASGGYVERSLDLSSFAGQTVQVTFTGTEDSSGATSFIVDDVSVTTE